MGAGQSNLSIVSEFLNSQSATGDVGKALMDTTVAFKIVIWVIMVAGAIAMAIWIGRLAIDILLIVTRGMGDGNKFKETVSKWGTGKDGTYSTVGAYLSGNLLEIVLVMILVALLMTGYLLRLIAFGITGVGTMLNKLIGLDVGGSYSALDAEAFAEQVQVQRATSLRNQYDQQLASARNYSAELYDMAKNGAISDDPQFNQVKSYYTQSMVKANIISGELLSRGGVVDEMKLGEGHFRQHLRQSGDGVCNDNFFVDDVIETFNVGGADANVSCTR